jgi:hypothetical protein
LAWFEQKAVHVGDQHHPLVDVMLVLLIVFMVTALMMKAFSKASGQGAPWPEQLVEKSL